ALNVVAFHLGNGAPCDTAGEVLLGDDAQIAAGDDAAVARRKGCCQLQRREQHAQPTRRPTAYDRKADAAGAQLGDGGLRPPAQRLVGGEESAVDIGNDRANGGWRYPHGEPSSLAMARQCRWSRASSSSASTGPVLPAGYCGSICAPSCTQASKIGATTRQPASILSAR